MIEVINLILKWLMPPFLVYLVHPIFMGMVVPSKIHKWWQVVLLAAGVSLFNIPKMIWGIYSAPAAAFRVIATVVLMLVIPLTLFEGPVWKRLVINMFMFSSQMVGEGVSVWILTNPMQVRLENAVTQTVGEALIYTGIATMCVIGVNYLIIVFARSMQGHRFLPIYIPLMSVFLSSWGLFYIYVSDGGVLISCICLVMSGVAIIGLLYYVVSLENKAKLEEELRDIRYRMELEQAHYKSVEIRQEELARIRHDFNNQLAVICSLMESGEDSEAQQIIRQLGDDIAATRENPYCANPVINAVLSEKEKKCREKDIILAAELDIPAEIGVEQVHLCSIFANLLDNAIAGAANCGQLPSQIHLSSAAAGDYLLIKTVNPSAPPHKPGRGHGYGSRILKELAEQYGGSYQTGFENGIYTAVVSLLIRE